MLVAALLSRKAAISSHTFPGSDYPIHKYLFCLWDNVSVCFGRQLTSNGRIKGSHLRDHMLVTRTGNTTLSTPVTKPCVMSLKWITHRLLGISVFQACSSIGFMKLQHVILWETRCSSDKEFRHNISPFKESKPLQTTTQYKRYIRKKHHTSGLHKMTRGHGQ